MDSRFWLLTTLMGLYKLHLKTLPNLRAKLSLQTQPAFSASVLPPDEAKARSDLSDAEWTNRKLLADLVFVCAYGLGTSGTDCSRTAYDVFDVKWFAEPVQCIAGLTAALIA
jgi:hypothetical protein